MSNELSMKESIRLGQAMNIVGEALANSDNVVNFEMEHCVVNYKRQVIALYKVLTEIERGVVNAKSSSDQPVSSTPIAIKPFPIG